MDGWMNENSIRHLVDLGGVVFSSHSLSQIHQLFYVLLKQKEPSPQESQRQYLSEESGMWIFSIKVKSCKIQESMISMLGNLFFFFFFFLFSNVYTWELCQSW